MTCFSHYPNFFYFSGPFYRVAAIFELGKFSKTLFLVIHRIFFILSPFLPCGPHFYTANIFHDLSFC